MNFNIQNIALALLSAFLGSLKGLLVSKVKLLGAIEIFGLRSIGAVCFILPLIIYTDAKLWYDAKSNTVLLLRSVIGNIAVGGYYFGCIYLPISEASMLFYSTPIFTVLIGCIFLKEKCGFLEVIATLLSVLGVGLVCVPDLSPDFTEISNSALKGVIGSLIGALAQAVALVAVRKITHVPPTVNSLWWAAVGVVFSTILCGALNEMVLWRCGWEVIYIILIAIIGFISDICLVSALKFTDAFIVSIALTTEIVWAFVLQITINKEIPSYWSILGGIFIGISVSLIPIVSITFTRKRTDIEKN